MIARLLETPLLDVLLIVLLMRLFFPSLFGIKSKSKLREEKERTTIHTSSSGEPQKFKKDEGEYIDYEEVK
jgi:hypothetical protein